MDVARRVSLILLMSTSLFAACDSPSFVDVKVVNETEYSTDVVVRGDSDDASLTLGYVGPISEREFREVIDQGATWTFTFGYIGRHEESLTLEREELERSEWRVEVPESFARTLRELGLSPPP